MGKIFTLCVCLLGFALGGRAQSVKAAWLAMPDTLSPYLTKAQREECIDLKEKNLEAKVANMLQGETVLDTLTTVYLQATLSQSATLQMRVMPADGADSLICVVKTLQAPAKESEVSFYDSSWRPLTRLQQAVDSLLEALPAKLVSRPDSMTEERYQELVQMIDPVMVEAMLSPDEDALTFRLSTPLLPSGEKEAVARVLSQRKFKWNGHSFNEY